ncbi:hypothetical protein NT6N_29520 [Oceaniferula spumae]|uniref:DUF1439 domain-containing protein n=1 Tax=Oceaniferula spumae TaxID=2979115 RepID=A0AAT9FP72_9BACT
MKKALITLIILLAIALAGTYAYFKGKRYEVVITQEQIDDTLNEKFPITKSALIIFQLTYSNPQVTLLPDTDRVQVGLDASLVIKINDQPKTLRGGITVTCGLRYDQETQSFYLTDTEFDRFELDGLPDKYEDKITLLASQYARQRLEKYPVYKLRATDTKKAAAKLLLKDVEIQGQEIHITLGL